VVLNASMRLSLASEVAARGVPGARIVGAAGVLTRPEAGIKKRKGDGERKQRNGLHGTGEKRNKNYGQWHLLLLLLL
jgi:hypothetical protein